MHRCKVTQDGYVAGAFHEAGEVLDLTERQRATGLRRGVIEDAGKGATVAEPKAEPEAQEKPQEAAGSEIDDVRAQLDALGIKYRSDAKLGTLKGKLAGAKD